MEFITFVLIGFLVAFRHICQIGYPAVVEIKIRNAADAESLFKSDDRLAILVEQLYVFLIRRILSQVRIVQQKKDNYCCQCGNKTIRNDNDNILFAALLT